MLKIEAEAHARPRELVAALIAFFRDKPKVAMRQIKESQLTALIGYATRVQNARPKDKN